MSAFWNTFLLDLPVLVSATITTIVLALVAGVIAMVIAIPVGFGRLSRVTIIRSLCTTYVEVVRGTPLLLQLLDRGKMKEIDGAKRSPSNQLNCVHGAMG